MWAGQLRLRKKCGPRMSQILIDLTGRSGAIEPHCYKFIRGPAGQRSCYRIGQLYLPSLRKIRGTLRAGPWRPKRNAKQHEIRKRKFGKCLG